jgi:tetratricopeptide (TPR) repeat protein
MQQAAPYAAAFAVFMFLLLVALAKFGRKSPQGPTAWKYTKEIDAAAKLIKLQQYDGAQSILVALLRKSDAPGRASHMLAAIAEQQGKWDEARLRWRAVRKHSPQQVDGYVGECRNLIRLGRVKEADALLAKARKQVTLPELLVKAYAEAAEADKDWETAARVWEEVRRAAPGDVDGYVKGYAALIQTGRTNEAAAVLADGTMRFPSHPKVLKAAAAGPTSGKPAV